MAKSLQKLTGNWYSMQIPVTKSMTATPGWEEQQTLTPPTKTREEPSTLAEWPNLKTMPLTVSWCQRRDERSKHHTSPRGPAFPRPPLTHISSCLSNTKIFYCPYLREKCYINLVSVTNNTETCASLRKQIS